MAATGRIGKEENVDILLNSRLGPELLRVLITGSFFALGIVVGWLLGKWRRYRQLRQAERGEAREVLTIEKILLERLPDGLEAHAESARAAATRSRRSFPIPRRATRSWPGSRRRRPPSRWS